MKHTTNYIIYLSSDNSVYSAKCRLTGKFVKRVIAQAEYEIEYVYKHSIASLMTLFIAFSCYYASSVNVVASELLSDYTGNISNDSGLKASYYYVLSIVNIFMNILN